MTNKHPLICIPDLYVLIPVHSFSCHILIFMFLFSSCTDSHVLVPILMSYLHSHALIPCHISSFPCSRSPHALILMSSFQCPHFYSRAQSDPKLPDPTSNLHNPPPDSSAPYPPHLNNQMMTAILTAKVNNNGRGASVSTYLHILYDYSMRCGLFYSCLRLQLALGVF